MAASMEHRLTLDPMGKPNIISSETTVPNFTGMIYVIQPGPGYDQLISCYSEMASGFVEELPTWHHGSISRKDSDIILSSKEDGSFLVRSTINSETATLSVKHNDGVKNYILRTNSRGKICIANSIYFDDIEELFKYYGTHDDLGVKLLFPIPKDLTTLSPKGILHRTEINTSYKLGHNCFGFGNVYEAEWTTKKQKVAVRSLNKKYNRPIKDMLKAAAMLVEMNHPNVTKFFGICVQESPIFIVTEFVPKGNLIDYLPHYFSDIGPTILLSMAQQICDGMCYLAAKGIVHHDLSCRNCLVGENHAIKVSSYELFQLTDYSRYSDTLLQMYKAPEVIRDFSTLSTASNAWNFGMVLWELAAYGSPPYTEIRIDDLYTHLEEGYRLEKPDRQCPEEMYTLMMKCWEWLPSERPVFQQIKKEIEEIIIKEKQENMRTVKLSDIPFEMTEVSLKDYVKSLSAEGVGPFEDFRFDAENRTALVVYVHEKDADQLLSLGTLQEFGEHVIETERYTLGHKNIEENVLSEIRNLGLETTKEFEEIMKKGSYKRYWNRVYLVGNYNVGKTTLAKILVGDPVPEVRTSTDGIWLYIGLAGMDIEQRKWIHLPKGNAIRTVLTTMLMSMKSRDVKHDKSDVNNDKKENASKSTLKPDESPTPHQRQVEDPEEKLDPDDQLRKSPAAKDSHKSHLEGKPLPKSELDEHFMADVLETMSNEKLRELVVEVAKEGKYKMKIVPIDIWDFGGQKDYYMTHQLFINSRGIFVLMFNGSHDIHKHLADLGFLPGHHGKPTIAVYLKHWVNSILTYCRRTKQCFPRILFVATHRDKIPKDKLEAHRQMLIKSIDELFKDHAGRGHFEYHSLLFIDARDKSDPEIDTLKQILIERVFDHPCWGEDMPTAWIPLELELAQEVEHGKSIISKMQLEALNDQNKSFKLNEKHLVSFLKIQHALGKLIYFDDIDLRNFVVINPVYMIEILRSIVTDKQFWPRGEQFTDAHRRLRQHGIIDKSTILSIWEQEEFRHILPHKKFVLNILIHLDIIVAQRTGIDTLHIPVSDVSVFLVPCMITNPDRTDYLKKYCTPATSIILAYTFVDDVIPPALSYRFLGSCLTMWNLKDYKGQYMIFSDLAVVEVGKNHDVAIQVRGKRLVLFLVHACNRSKILPTLASSVQECLTAVIHRISEFYSSLAEDGDRPNSTKITTPFEIEFGVFCRSSICFFHHSKLPSTMKSEVKCQKHQINHNIRELHHWYAEKIPAEICRENCPGPGRLEMEQRPLAKHLRRLISELSFNTCREIAMLLGVKAHVWEDLTVQFQHDNIDNVKFMALWKWKQKDKDACFNHLSLALRNCDCNVHYLCQVFRDIEIETELSRKTLDSVPSSQSLTAVSDYIGNSSLQLGIELGLDVAELENIQIQLRNKPLEQTREILLRWKKYDYLDHTLRTLVKALDRIGKSSCLNDINF